MRANLKTGRILQITAHRPRPITFSTRTHAPSLASQANKIIPPSPAPHCTRPRPAQIRSLRRYTPSTSSSPTTSFPDPSRPELFYHLVEPPTPISPSSPAYALSFLPSSPVSPESSTIIGWLAADFSGSSHGTGEAGLNDFKENPFRDILHKAIQDGLCEEADDIQTNGATQLQDGWMHIHDDRNVPALGRIGDPDDILASVLVHSGKILPETYQPMPAYRLCTADGVIRLTPGLAQKLQSVLVHQAELEGRAGVSG